MWPSGFNCQPELRPTANGISSMKSTDSAEFRATTAKSATEIGICGMETRVQPFDGGLGHYDNTALNDVRFTCC